MTDSFGIYTEEINISVLLVGQRMAFKVIWEPGYGSANVGINGWSLTPLLDMGGVAVRPISLVRRLGVACVLNMG